MKKIYLMLPLLTLACAVHTNGAPLTPAEALERVMIPTTRHKAPDMGRWQLGHTFMQPKSMTPAMYVFTSSSQPGFMVVAADDTTAPLVGYSLTESIEPDNLPPAFNWWMNACAEIIAVKAAQSELPVYAAPRGAREAIDPIVKTKWNQDSPYNDQCPMLPGGRAMTGCVATAAAQVMNVHQWPATGTGELEYQFEYDGNTYTDSFDFGATTFDWDNMQNIYSVLSSPAQCQAVATLMHACGVASLMTYGVESSGATDFDLAFGLVNYLDYDKGVARLQHSWFEYADWEDLIYNELAAGRPVLFGGQSLADGGHEFVLDGYQSDDYFHVNWGWGGLADGYFSLSYLDPNAQGIGGSASGEGFDYDQSVIVGVQRPVQGSKYTTVMYCIDFMAEGESWPRSTGTNIVFDCLVYNLSVADIECEVGLQLKDKDGQCQYISIDAGVIPVFVGFSGLDVAATDMPVGTWDILPAVKPAGGQWTPAYYDIDSETVGVRLKVTDDHVQLVAKDEEVPEGEISVEFVGCSPVEPSDDAIYIGHDYDFIFNITSTGRWKGDLYLLMTEGNNVVTGTGPFDLKFNNAGTVTERWRLHIPEDLEDLPATYGIWVCYYDEEYDEFVGIWGQDFVVEDPSLPEEGELEYAGWIDDADTKYYPGETYDFNIMLEANGACSYDDIYCVLFGGNTLLALSDTHPVVFDQAGEQIETWRMSIPDDLETGSYYMGLARYNEEEDGWIVLVYWDIDISEIDGATSVGADPSADGDAVYFDLNGQRVMQPKTGQMYIRVTKASTKKVRY